jgi:3-oxoadipate enol-lactonase
MKVRANQVNMAYELAGPEGAPVVVLSHSLAATMAMWDPQMPALADKFRVLRYDLRGHGETDAPAGPYSIELLADDAHALLAALGIARYHFIGLSLGGMIAQALAIRHAPGLASIALCDTTSRVPPEAGPVWQDRIQAVETQGMTALVDPTIDRWFSKAFQERQPAVVDRVREMIRTTSVAGYVGCVHAIAALNLTDALEAVSVPALIIVGSDDPGTPVSASEEIQRRIKGSRLVVLDDAMHLSNLEQAAAFNQALLSFLASP